MNSVTLTGRTTREIELQESKNKVKYCRFALAVERRKLEGQDKPTVDFIQCIAFNKTAEVIQKFVKKGSKVLVIGELHQNNYKDKNGNETTSYTVNVEKIELCNIPNKKANATNSAPTEKDNYKKDNLGLGTPAPEEKTEEFNQDDFPF